MDIDIVASIHNRLRVGLWQRNLHRDVKSRLCRISNTAQPENRLTKYLQPGSLVQQPVGPKHKAFKCLMDRLVPTGLWDQAGYPGAVMSEA